MPKHAPFSLAQRMLLCLLTLAIVCCPLTVDAASGGEDVVLGGRDATGRNGVVATGWALPWACASSSPPASAAAGS